MFLQHTQDLVTNSAVRTHAFLFRLGDHRVQRFVDCELCGPDEAVAQVELGKHLVCLCDSGANCHSTWTRFLDNSASGGFLRGYSPAYPASRSPVRVRLGDRAGDIWTL